MAIRFSMSENTSILNLTSTGRKKRSSFEQINILKQQAQQNNIEEAASGSSKTQQSCKRSNIRAMQLFYEMKQEFPNIPDDVVNQHVIDNIQDPENCKAKLKSEKDSCLVPVQSYPQKLLRVLNQDSLLKKQVNPSKSSSVSLKNYNNDSSKKHLNENGCELSLLNEAAGFSKQNIFNRTKCKQILTPDIKDMRSEVCSIQITTYSTDQTRSHDDVLEKEKLKFPQVHPQRPTTLNLKKNIDLKNDFSQVNNNHQDPFNKQPTKNKITGSSVFSSSSNPQTQKISKSINTVTTIHSPTTYTDLGKSEILVNVSLSPSSHCNRVGGGGGGSGGGGTQRYQSTINVRPELPFTRNLESTTPPSNHKSYTSVNLVLRQPSSNPQSPIDITFGPNLTYSSSSYHARLGYQNNYQITVTDDCGVFSAFRISPLNYNCSRLDTIEKDVCDETPNELDADSGNCSSLQNSISKATTNSSGKSDDRKIIIRQHKQKERILAVLRKNKFKLSLVHKEVDFAMQTEINDGISEILDNEIDKLRCDCQTMLNEIENSRTCGLTIDSIQQKSTIKSRQAHSFPKYQALRYPAPISNNNNNCLQNQQRQSFPNEVVSTLRHPSIAYRDENSNFGAGD